MYKVFIYITPIVFIHTNDLLTLETPFGVDKDSLDDLLESRFEFVTSFFWILEFRY
jgi:hypothetical protein